MTEFELWYTYYDSLFTVSTPNLPQAFCLAHTLIKTQWPSSPCPALSECFSLLEVFLKNGDNWITSRCAIEQLSIISDNLNILLHFLSLEKQYASTFWSTDSRRVEASITHLYCFLQNLVKAIIPYPAMSIFQCKAAHKLCVEISKLQQLFKKIFKKINQMAQFLSDSRFQEERSLIINFFENFVSFMKQLPKIKRSQLNHVHHLTKYICLTNPIEIFSSSPRKTQKTRKKSCTIGTVYELQHKTADNVLLNKQKMEDSYRRFDDFIYRLPKRSNSCSHFFNPSNVKKENIKKNFIKIFSFPDRISKDAESSLIQKKNTLDSWRSLTTKMNSISKNKSNTLTTSTSPVSLKRMKTTSVITQDSPTPHLKKQTTFNRKRVESNVKFYEEEQERFQLNSMSSFRASVNDVGLHKIQGPIEINREHDKSQVFFGHTEKKKQIYALEGKNSGKRWEVVREWFWERVKMRKMKKLVDFSQFF